MPLSLTNGSAVFFGPQRGTRLFQFSRLTLAYNVFLLMP
jgi:hypothetical protein